MVRCSSLELLCHQCHISAISDSDNQGMIGIKLSAESALILEIWRSFGVMATPMQSVLLYRSSVVCCAAAFVQECNRAALHRASCSAKLPFLSGKLTLICCVCSAASAAVRPIAERPKTNGTRSGPQSEIRATSAHDQTGGKPGGYYTLQAISTTRLACLGHQQSNESYSGSCKVTQLNTVPACAL
jgi:hypothetical protein